MSVTLKATKQARMAQCFNLPHVPYCEPGSCSCTTREHATQSRSKSGAHGIKMINLRTPRCIVLLPGTSVSGLNSNVSLCPEVAAAVAAGLVQVVKQ